MKMTFDEAHAQRLQKHLAGRTGERRSRLERGHGHGEALYLKNIWWEQRGNLDDFHPEFEVLD